MPLGCQICTDSVSQLWHEEHTVRKHAHMSQIVFVVTDVDKKSQLLECRSVRG